MSPKFELVKRYYDAGLWDEQRVKNAINKWITEEEYLHIINQSDN